MTFATFTNIATMAFCLAVLVQSVRMMRSFRAVKEGALTDVVGALDHATAQARIVLSELKAALGGCAQGGRILKDSKAIAEELEVLIEIANASADRLTEAGRHAHRVDPAPETNGEAEALAA